MSWGEGDRDRSRSFATQRFASQTHLPLFRLNRGRSWEIARTAVQPVPPINPNRCIDKRCERRREPVEKWREIRDEGKRELALYLPFDTTPDRRCRRTFDTTCTRISIVLLRCSIHFRPIVRCTFSVAFGDLAMQPTDSGRAHDSRSPPRFFAFSTCLARHRGASSQKCLSRGDRVRRSNTSGAPCYFRSLCVSCFSLCPVKLEPVRQKRGLGGARRLIRLESFRGDASGIYRAPMTIGLYFSPRIQRRRDGEKRVEKQIKARKSSGSIFRSRSSLTDDMRAPVRECLIMTSLIKRP